MNTNNSDKLSSKVWFWIALVISWPCFIFFFTAPVGLLVWLGVLILLFARKSPMKWYLIFLSAWVVVPTCSFIQGTTNYITGDARLESVGLPDAEYNNLDPQYRVWNASSGCTVVGYEKVVQASNNCAVKLWTNLFGYQQEVYTGVYPDETSTALLLDSLGSSVNYEWNDDVYSYSINGESISLNASRFSYSDSYRDSILTAKTAMIGEDLVIFQPKTIAGVTQTLLVDQKTGKVFAIYYDYR